MVSNETDAKQIIDVAFAMLAEKGVEGFTMRAIASKMGCGAPKIYRLFPSKDELLVAIAVEKLEEMTSGLRQHLKGIIGTSNKLRKFTWFILDFIDSQPHFASLMIRALPLRYWRSMPMLSRLRDQAAILAEIVEDGQRAGEVRSDIDIRAFRNIYFGGLRRLTDIWLLQDMRQQISDSTEEFINIMLDGIRKQPVDSLSFKCPFVEELESLKEAQQQKR